jgi:eukaryotic-like serine/threonine-protein kinase
LVPAATGVFHLNCSACHASNPERSDFCSSCGGRLRPATGGDNSPTGTESGPVRELATGTLFAGRYQVIEQIGAGGMGRIYKVFDTEVKEKLALKLLAPEIALDAHAMERFRNELRLARKIRHPRVCQLFDLGSSDGVLFITMEYVSGEDLKSMIRMSHQVSVGATLHVARQVCEGLVEAHGHGIVHCDLKPQNIMVDREGNTRIMDFGIARTVGARLPGQSGVMIGTPEYMSPEQVDSRDVDHRTDLYALGVVMYEMLTGRLPFGGDTPVSIALKHKTERPSSPSSVNAQVPDGVARIVLRCLDKDKTKRYQDAAELMADLDRAQAAVPATSKLSPRRSRTSGVVQLGWRRFLPHAAVAVVLCAVVVAGFFYVRGTGSTVTSIAVLPFTVSSASPDTDLLADGIPDNLTGRLSEFASLKKVIASSSTARYKNKPIDPTEVGRELDVAALVTGRIQRDESGVSVSVELVNTSDGSILWRKRYALRTGGSLALGEEIARDAIGQLQLRLTSGNRERMAKRSTQNSDAYQAYLKGRFYWNKRTKTALLTGLQYFQEAIANDPNYALAHVGVADSWALLGRYSHVAPAKAMPEARAAAERALQLDSQLGEAYTSLGFIKRYFDFDWAGAERDFRKSIELSPGYATAYHWYALLLTTVGRHDEAKATILRAQELDPLSLIISTNVGWVEQFARRYDASIEQLNRTLQMDPNYPTALGRRGEALLRQSKADLAVADFSKGVGLAPEDTELRAGLAAAYAVAGRQRESEEILKTLLARPAEEYVSPYDIAIIYAALGQKATALDWLDRAFDGRAGRMAWIKVDPALDSLRAEPRFKAILARMGLDR